MTRMADANTFAFLQFC